MTGHRIAATVAAVALFFVVLVVADAGRRRLAPPVPAETASTLDGLVMLMGLEPPPDGRTPATDFSLPALGGDTIRLAELKGQVVLLNFWATWCPPCRAEMPSMERAYQAYRAQGFRVVAIDYREGPELVEPFVKGLGLTFPIALDRDGSVTDSKYPTGGLPTTYLIDRQGRAVARRLGYVEWDSAAARALIEALLAEPAAPSEVQMERAGR
jgi:thiol-disulfide isomerase/thioredoxin